MTEDEFDPFSPCKAQPGSDDKLEVLALRYAEGAPLWHEEDSGLVDDDFSDEVRKEAAPAAPMYAAKTRDRIQPRTEYVLHPTVLHAPLEPDRTY